MDTSDWLATIALIISIFSAAFTGTQVYLQVLQYKRDNHPLVVSTVFANGHGYMLQLKNPSSRTALIDHWELVWRKRVFLFWYKEDRNPLPGGDFSLIIDPGRSKDLEFKDPFPFPSNPLDRGRLYIELHPSGAKRPYLLWTRYPINEKTRLFFR